MDVTASENRQEGGSIHTPDMFDLEFDVSTMGDSALELLRGRLTRMVQNVEAAQASRRLATRLETTSPFEPDFIPKHTNTCKRTSPQNPMALDIELPPLKTRRVSLAEDIGLSIVPADLEDYEQHGASESVSLVLPRLSKSTMS